MIEVGRTGLFTVFCMESDDIPEYFEMLVVQYSPIQTVFRSCCRDHPINQAAPHVITIVPVIQSGRLGSPLNLW